MNILKLFGLCKLSQLKDAKDELKAMSGYADLLETAAKKAGVNVIGHDESHYDKNFDGSLFVSGSRARLVRCATDCLVVRPDAVGLSLIHMRAYATIGHKIDLAARPDLNAELEKLLNPDRIEIINPINLNKFDGSLGISIRTPKTQWAEGEIIDSPDPYYVWRCDEAGSPGVWSRRRRDEVAR